MKTEKIGNKVVMSYPLLGDGAMMIEIEDDSVMFFDGYDEMSIPVSVIKTIIEEYEKNKNVVKIETPNKEFLKDRPLKSEWRSVDHMQDIKPYEQLFVACKEVVDDDGDVSEACVVLGMLTLKKQLVYQVWHGGKMFHGIKGATHYIPSALILP